jgi:hypothetical protein
MIPRGDEARLKPMPADRVKKLYDGLHNAGGLRVVESECTVLTENEATCNTLDTSGGVKVTIAIARNGVDFIPLRSLVRARKVYRRTCLRGRMQPCLVAS